MANFAAIDRFLHELALALFCSEEERFDSGKFASRLLD
jgi:hypothetical protein